MEEKGDFMKYDRQQEMETFIREAKTVRNEELLNRFNISIQTLRRDLKTLEDQGTITKVYGGVIYNEPQDALRNVDSYETRSTSFIEEKEYIGKLAAKMVKDNDVIFIDSGTTAYRMLHYMQDLKNVTVISHCLDVMQVLRNMPHLNGICAGGTLLHEAGSFLIDTSFYPYNYNKAFISTVGISIAKGLTNTVMQEGYMKSHAISQANRVYLLADHSKFDVIGYNHFADLSNINVIITDRCPDEKYLSIFASNQTKIAY